MPIELTNFAPSKKPYAINWDSLRIERIATTRSDGTVSNYLRPRVEALWAGRKNGATYVSWGDLGTGGGGLGSREELIANFDCRYGGHALARWNGHDLWAPGYDPAWCVAKAAELDAVLRDLPNLPVGYDGWYRLT